MSETLEDADRALTEIEARFAMWRFHMWHLNQGSYEEIEQKAATGKLNPFVCPQSDCDCHWRKEQPNGQQR